MVFETKKQLMAWMELTDYKYHSTERYAFSMEDKMEVVKRLGALRIMGEMTPVIDF